MVSAAKEKLMAGLARASITPPAGTRMYGYGGRDKGAAAKGVHDELYVNALYLNQGGEEALIMGFDLLFFSRAEADRYMGAVGRATGLSARQILLNTSHTHSGPMLNMGTWMYGETLATDKSYADAVECATVEAALDARSSAAEASIWAGMGRTRLPMSRRKKDENGKVLFAPDPEGEVCDLLPVCLLKNAAGQPVTLLFSVSCHPSTIQKHEFSAEYPGVATELLDKHLGAPCGLFLQGAGGDAKPSVVAEADRFRYGSWDDVSKAGGLVAKEVIEILDGGLKEVEPQLRTCLINIELPLEPPKSRSEYEAIAEDAEEADWKRRWAKRKARRLEEGQKLPSSVPVTVHGMQLGKGVRIVGLEGEAVGGLGNLISNFYGEGVTFPLGYTDGCQMYLPTSPMLEEGGYEADSFDEYGYPSRLAPGIEKILTRTLEKMRASGIE